MFCWFADFRIIASEGKCTTKCTQTQGFCTIHKIRKTQNLVFNFKRTVLQGYLELEAGTGTTWKLTLSTFTLKKHFSFSTNFRSSNLTKTKRLWIRFRINFTVWSPFEMRMFAIFPRFIARYETYPICKTGATSVRVRSPQPVNMGSQLEIKRNNHSKKQSALRNLELICLRRVGMPAPVIGGYCGRLVRMTDSNVNSSAKKLSENVLKFHCFPMLFATVISLDLEL